ncbi:MAG: Gfo/Idh/MocA family oxidoreductase [Rubripirellula sp.]|nr:Gfo/Idh/MocA family oxidoreductase [Rubripirellula sp.]
MSNLKAAVIGTGFIGPVHVEALQRAGVDVAGILGSTPEKSVQAADTLGLKTGYASLEALLSDKSVQVVHIASPNRFHFDQAERSLRAGKHVVCEKPLAMNTTESSQLVRLAQESGLAAAVNYNIRYYPLCLEAASQISSGSVGQIFHASASYAQDWLFHSTDFNWRVQSDAGGALRAVADIGTHALDLLQFITGRKVESVFADLATVYPHRERPLGGVQTFSDEREQNLETETIPVTTEDYGCLMLRMSGGARGVLHVSQVTAGRKNCLRFEIAGSKKSLSWCSESPNELQMGHRDEPNQTLIRDPALMSERAARASTYPGGHNEGFSDTFKQLFRDVYRAIESEEYKTCSTFPTFSDGHDEVALCEAVLKSHQQQQWVHLRESTL